VFRQLIALTDRDTGFTLFGEIELDDSYFGGKRKGNRGQGSVGGPGIRYLGTWRESPSRGYAGRPRRNPAHHGDQECETGSVTNFVETSQRHLSAGL